MTTVPAEAPAPAAPPSATRPDSPHPRKKRRFPWAPLALLTPALIMLVVFIGWPLLQLVIMSFQKFGRAQIFGAPPEFIGLDIFVGVLTDPEFWAVLGRSIALCIVSVAATMALGVVIALQPSAAMFQSPP